MMKKSGKDKQTMSGKHSVYMIRNYINEIISQSGLRRQSARLALVEIGDNHCATCFADGVQMVTGCTFGKGNIQKLHYGKWA